MGGGIIKAFIIISVAFGVLGAIAAFVNAYEGYSHFPALSKRRRIVMSLEFAGLALMLAVAAAGIAIVIMKG